MDTSDPSIAGGKARPTGIGQLTRPTGNRRQHTICAKPAQGEQQRTQRRAVGPLQIVDGEHHDLTAGLETVKQIHKPSSGGHRVRPWLRHGPGLQLVDDSIRKQRFRLVATDLEDDSIR